MILCRSCGKENKDGERSCCYCLASLVVDVDALFLAVQKGNVDLSALPVLEDSSEDSQLEELLLLSDSVLEPVVPRQDYSDIFALSAQLRESQTLALQRSTLRDLARTALRLSRGLGRIEPMRWGRKPLVLFLEGVSNEDAWKEMMELLDIPLFTARYLCSGRVFDFVRHDNDRMSLEALAVQYRNRFSARAVVISRAQLEEYPPPMACLGLRRSAFRIVDAPLWRENADAMLEEEVTLTVRIAVVGMVEEVHYREAKYTEVRSFGRRKTDSVRKKSTDKKIGVIDLHCDDVMIRIAEGVTDFSTLPGFEKGAQRKSFQNLCRLLSVWLPHAAVIDQKVMRVQGQNIEKMVEHAWDGWERYSYSIRRLILLK